MTAHEPRDSDDPHDVERRKIVRRISFLTWGLAAGAVLMAVAGGALIAWILMGIGMPFVRTWLILSALLLAVPAAVHLAPKPWKKDTKENG